MPGRVAVELGFTKSVATAGVSGVVAGGGVGVCVGGAGVLTACALAAGGAATGRDRGGLAAAGGEGAKLGWVAERDCFGKVGAWTTSRS